MIERDEGYEVSDITDSERRAVFFNVGRALIGPPRPNGGVDLDEKQLEYAASRPFFDEVWQDLFEVYREMRGAVSELHMQRVLEEARERPGIPVQISEGEEVAAGRIIAVVGYHPEFPNAITGMAAVDTSDVVVPVTIWPGTERVEALKIIQ